MPGLDGLRALAVLAVLAYHLDIGWAQGGLLGVGIFFTLSGYLITDLLLEQWVKGGIRLGDFWLRRARRLLPALFVVLIAVTAWVTLLEPSELEPLRGAVASAAGYVSNWWMIFQEVPYADRFGPPSPLGHLWSLAIEEQFYLVWPFVLLLGLRFVREPVKRSRVRLRLAAVTLVLAAASAVLMAMLYQPGLDSIRVYDGTDTRAFGLLIGAALAMVWPARRLVRPIAASARRLLDRAGLACLVVIAVLIWRTDYFTAFLYPYGLVLLSVATARADPGARPPRDPARARLRMAAGALDRGAVLRHLPLALPGDRADDPAPRPRLRARPGGAADAGHVRARGALVALGRGPDPPRRPRPDLAAGALARRGADPAGDPAARLGGPRGRGRGNRDRGLRAQRRALDRPRDRALGLDPGAGRRGRRERPPAAAQAGQRRGPASRSHGPPRTSCDAVVHLGDSTSEGLVSPSYLPDPRRRIDSQYARVGVGRSRMEIEGATSIVELPPDDTNARDAAEEIAAGGYGGCWVVALGTNDSANAAIGSPVGVDERIDLMMSVIGERPALWLTARSLLGGGAYADEHMRAWNAALLRACDRYPNLRVFDWAAAVRDEWFIEDGIHYTSDGYAARAHRIAIALAEAFPAGDRSPDCVVG